MVWLQILNIIALIGTLAVNALAVTLPINGKSTGELSDNIPVLFTPSGYVFSIWSLIYLGLIVFTIYQILPARRDGELVNRICTQVDDRAGIDKPLIRQLRPVDTAAVTPSERNVPPLGCTSCRCPVDGLAAANRL